MATQETHRGIWGTGGDFSTFMRRSLQPMALLAGLTAAALLLVFALSALGAFESLGWQLPVLALALFAIALAHRPIVDLARRGKGAQAFTWHSGATVLLGLMLVVLWDGAGALAALAVWAAPIIAFGARPPQRRYVAAVVLSIGATVVIVLLANRAMLPRMTSGTTGSFAALLLVASMMVLFIILTLANETVRYRTLQSRLVGSLIPVIAVPIVFTTAIAAYNALVGSQQQFRDSLEAVTSLKGGELDAVAQADLANLASVQQGSVQAPSIMHVLQRPGATDDEYRLNASIAATDLRDLITAYPASDFEETLAMDAAGNVILSTYVLNQGVSFANEEFFQQGLLAPTSRFIPYPGTQNASGEYKLVSAVPFFGTNADQALGVIVGVSGADAVTSVLEPPMGLQDVTTYMVDANAQAVLPAPAAPRRIQAGGIVSVVDARSGSGSGTYRNHAGVAVLGYYSWDEALQLALVSEIPQSAVIGRSFSAVLASGLVGLLTIIIAAVAVLAASRSLSEPVTGLAQTAQRLAAGDLSARAAAGGEDEIGRLAGSFNSMAVQMQGIIANLEQRVVERTRALEDQSLRLRTSAEIARDAALAPTLEELLDRAARLVLERFGVDHVGIFLLDETRQYAVLQAAPAASDLRMVQDNYRVAVGDKSTVGQAALTGEPLLAIAGITPGLEPGDSYHTLTRSQLTLPLRTNEGTIGLLDLQADSAEALETADISIVQVLADQLATAIERGRLLVQVQQRLSQLEDSYRRFTQNSWSTYTTSDPRARGYRYDKVRLDPVSVAPADAHKALETGKAYVSGNGTAGGKQTAHVPIRLRGEVLGVVSANFREGRASARSLALLEQAADRLGTALENVRLLEDSLRRASKERLVSDITSKISSSVSMRNVLQTAVEELGRAMPGSEVSIKFRGEGPAHGKDGLA